MLQQKINHTKNTIQFDMLQNDSLLGLKMDSEERQSDMNEWQKTILG